jgi:hypothetical protein
VPKALRPRAVRPKTPPVPQVRQISTPFCGPYRAGEAPSRARTVSAIPGSGAVIPGTPTGRISLQKCLDPEVYGTPPHTSGQPASPQAGGPPGTGWRRPWTRRRHVSKFSMNHATARRQQTLSTSRTANPFACRTREAALSQCNLTLRQRRLHRGVEAYIAVQNVTLPHRSLHRRIEGYIAP